MEELPPQLTKLRTIPNTNTETMVVLVSELSLPRPKPMSGRKRAAKTSIPVPYGERLSVAEAAGAVVCSETENEPG